MLAPVLSKEGYFLSIEPPSMREMPLDGDVFKPHSAFNFAIDKPHLFLRLLDPIILKEYANLCYLSNIPFYDVSRIENVAYRTNFVMQVFDVSSYYMRSCFSLDDELSEICDDLDRARGALREKDITCLSGMHEKWAGKKGLFISMIENKREAVLLNPSFVLAVLKEDPLYPIPHSLICDPRFYMGRKHLSAFLPLIKEPLTINFIKRLGNFAGLATRCLGEDITSGNSISAMLELCNEAIYRLSFDFNIENLGEIQRAFDRASDIASHNKEKSHVVETLEKIQRGELVFIPVGYDYSNSGHVTNLVFYRDKFAFCSRGARPIGQKEVACFTYSPANLTIEILLSLQHIERCDFKNYGEKSDYLEERFYTFLSKKVGAVPFDIDGFIRFKPQIVVPNCTKSSHFTAFKFAIFLKALGEGKGGKEAGIIAKHIGDIASHYMRCFLEKGVERECAEYDIPDVKKILEESKAKTARKWAKIERAKRAKDSKCVIS